MVVDRECESQMSLHIYISFKINQRFALLPHHAMPFPFVLDKSALLFIPPSSESSCRYPSPSVVQVIIKPARVRAQDEAVAFAAVQGEITRAVSAFLAIARGEVDVPESLVIEGEGYSLYGTRKEWALADRLKLLWGEVPIQCCRWKWRFVFQLH